MKKAVVCGAGGFIGSHLVKYLKARGYWVRGVDLKRPEFAATLADEFQLLDLRDPSAAAKSLKTSDAGFDEVYQLAADMGGMGFIHTEQMALMRNSALININMLDAATQANIPRYFFSSSVCIYPDMMPGDPEMTEEQAYPALPHNEYGWEKLYAERMALTAARKTSLEVRIARFQNCYGEEGTWEGGREKAPAAICRKVAEVKDGGVIEVWGDGSAVRSYTYVDDMVDGIYTLMQSELAEPVNIGSPEYHSVNELVHTVAKVAQKRVEIAYIDGPVGVQSRNFSNQKIYSIGWKPKTTLEEGIARTYPWVEAQVREKGKA